MPRLKKSGDLRPPPVGETVLELHDPYLIWDRAPCEGVECDFFRYAKGLYRYWPSGERRLLTEEYTNMTMQGQLAPPLEYDAREIRFYPACAEMVECWKFVDWEAVDLSGHGEGSRIQISAVDHLPLPEVDDWTANERALPENRYRVSLAKEAYQIRSIINGDRLPCLVADLGRTFESNSPICFRLVPKKTMAAAFGLEIYCVLVGGLWLR